MSFKVLLESFNPVLILFIFLALGYFIRRINIVDNSFSKNLSRFLFSIILPAMIIKSMLLPYDIKILKDAALLLIICVFIVVFSIILARYVSKLLSKDNVNKNVYELSLIFSNYALMAYPLVEVLYGDIGILYVSIFVMPYRFIYNTYGILLIQRQEGDKIKLSMKNLLNPPIISVFIGILFFIFSISLPTPIDMSIRMLSKVFSPLGMILAGLVVAQNDLKGVFKNKKVYIVSVFRLVVIPLIIFFTLRIFIKDELLIILPTLVMAMPVAATSPMLTEKFNGNSYLASQNVFISTLLSVITIPIMILLFNKYV